jgi:hypothetical protein
MTSRPLTTLVLFALAAACSTTGTDPSPDAGTVPTGPDDAYFGLADKQCRHYKNARGTLDYTVEVRLDTTTVTGVRTYHLIHRFNGFVQREDWLEVTADSLLLHRRQDANGLDPTLSRYTPPPVWLKKGLGEGDSVDSDTTAKVALQNGPQTDHAQQFSTVAFPAEDLTIGGSTVSATKFTVSVTDGATSTVDKVWLAPQAGLVKLNPAGTAIEDETFTEATVINGSPCVD